ncbi:hypothetical protein EAF04_006820 [Stromatinia cepivora]|nr:hypothetical protein EAF04_006820 [Stromatinia cepivora]
MAGYVGIKQRTSENYHKIIISLHKKYGKVIRFVLNDLDFASPQAYQDIHGHIKQGKSAFLKKQTYNTGSEINIGIISAKDPAVHREIRKSLSHTFSTKAFRFQEEVVIQYIDLLVSRIHRCKDNKKGLNLLKYNWLTFDTIRDFTFGESFDAVKSGEGHPWISLIFSTVHLMALMEILRRFPFLMNLFFKKVATFLMPKGLKEKSKIHFQNSMRKATQRMERGNNDRDDFFSHLPR